LHCGETATAANEHLLNAPNGHKQLIRRAEDAEGNETLWKAASVVKLTEEYVGSGSVQLLSLEGATHSTANGCDEARGQSYIGTGSSHAAFDAEERA